MGQFDPLPGARPQVECASRMRSAWVRGGYNATGGSCSLASFHQALDPRLAASVLSLLRGEAPAFTPDREAIDVWLNRYELGGYLFAQWSADGRLTSLPVVWQEAFRRAHRKTAVDSLAALAEFRLLGRFLVDLRVPVIVLKGGAYLNDLYQDPGTRRLTDIDLLMHREDAGRLARRLLDAGYRGETAVDYPWNRRFEMWRPVEGACRFELHWSILDDGPEALAERLWERSVPVSLEGVPCRRLDPVDAIPYHSAHLAAHYIGPQLKWVVDLREMLRQWRPDLAAVSTGCSTWRARTATSLALTHVSRLFPGEVPTGWIEALFPGRIQRALYGLYRSEEPLDLFRVSNESAWRFPLRPLTMDGPGDALRLGWKALGRAVARAVGPRRDSARHVPPWAWCD